MTDSIVLPREETSLADLRPHPQNYKKHPEEQISHLVASLQEFGFYRNVVIARDGTILAGHGIVIAAERLGYETVPVVRLDLDADSPEALKVLALDNEVPRLAVDDDRQLAELLRRISEETATGLLGTGYDEDGLGALLSTMADPEPPLSFPDAEVLAGHVEHHCPRCGYEWSGSPAPAGGSDE